MQHFLRGPTVILTDQLPGVKESTIVNLAYGHMTSTTLRQLELRGFDYADEKFAAALKNMNSLRFLNLRYLI